jgi:hypothetical protein
VGEWGISELTVKQFEKLYAISEMAAGRSVLTRGPFQGTEALNIGVEAEGENAFHATMRLVLLYRAR